MPKEKTVQNVETQATIHIQETKEPETEKPILTVKERIDKVVDNYVDRDELKKQIFQLVQRILYPEQFCPECDERMFFNPTTSSYNCPNCGHESNVIAATTVGVAKVAIKTTNGKIPDIVEKTIAEANESMKEIAIPTKPGSLGDKIRKLVSDRDAGGSSSPTKEAEAQLRSDKNVANKVNWI